MNNHNFWNFCRDMWNSWLSFTMKSETLQTSLCEFRIKWVSNWNGLGDHPHITSAKGLGGWVWKMVVFDDDQYYIYADIFGSMLHRYADVIRGLIFPRYLQRSHTEKVYQKGGNLKIYEKKGQKFLKNRTSYFSSPTYPPFPILSYFPWPPPHPTPPTLKPDIIYVRSLRGHP